MVSDLTRVIEQVGKDKGIDKTTLVETIKAAMLTAARRRYGQLKDIEAQYNEGAGEVELFEFKTVVSDVRNAEMEISLEEAKELDPESECGDSIGMKLDTTEFGRIAAHTARQVIIQRLRDAERDNIYNDFKDRVGEVVNGTVQRFEGRDMIVNLGRAEALLPYREQVHNVSYRHGDRVRAYIYDVRQDTKGPQVMLSRTHPALLVEFFKMEVPEVYEGIVEIKGAAREPGERAKIAVISHDPDVDPVGACVGMRGIRVKSVVQELQGERIDIVPWSEDSAKFICNALSPAQITKVIIDEDAKIMEVIVEDDQLPLAIGKKGQNVRLAAKLTGWQIDIQSVTGSDKLSEQAQLDMGRIPGVGEVTAMALPQRGFTKVEDVAEADIELLAKVPGIGEKKAESIKESAIGVLTEEKEAADAEPEAGGADET